ncbi:MAG: hypothetical protein MJ124_03860 [Lachnospiraceae bacterium]|nr:hypothetical protein [Lachnospiraceae bacterium]
MVNNRKVRLMTRLAIYEEGEGKEDIRLGKYFRRDFVRLQLFKNIIAVTVGYLLLVALYMAYKLEFLISEAVKLDYAAMGRRLLALYLIILVVYIAGSLVFSMLYYNASRKKLAKYFRMLRLMRSFYREESEK